MLFKRTQNGHKYKLQFAFLSVLYLKTLVLDVFTTKRVMYFILLPHLSPSFLTITVHLETFGFDVLVLRRTA